MAMAFLLTAPAAACHLGFDPPALSSLRRCQSQRQHVLPLRPVYTPLSRRAPLTCLAATTAPAAVASAGSLLSLVPPSYGYVALTVAASAILIQWQAILVGMQRRKIGLKYPAMYENKEGSVFDCYQRAHLNTLENYPSFIAALLVAGTAYPITATVFGWMWILGRVFFSLGYYSGDPNKRHQGSWHFFGLYGLLITTIVFGVRHILGA